MIPRLVNGAVSAALLTLAQSCRAPATPLELADHHVHLLSPSLLSDWKSLGVPFSKPD